MLNFIGLNGVPRTRRAQIIEKSVHGIRRSDIDFDALKISRRLKSAGYAAYVVGGAVRDLLLGRRPKDFDMVTDAHPRDIKRLFRNSRIIGKRFRLVHIFFADKIIETSTFRAYEDSGDNNIYGTMQDDVMRRDFTANALFYDPEKEVIVDYVGGFRDIKAGRLKPVLPLKTIFGEDPVRMVRAVKYAAGLGFRMPFLLRSRLRASATLLGGVSSSRLTEEFFKIIQSGLSARVFASLDSFGLLAFFSPALEKRLRQSPGGFRERFFATLAEFDEELSLGSLVGVRERALCAVLKDFITDVARDHRESNSGRPLQYKDAYHEAKQFLRPLSPPNRDVDLALTAILRKKKPKLKNQPHAGVSAHAHHAPLEEPEAAQPTRRRRRRRRPRAQRPAAGPGEPGAV